MHSVWMEKMIIYAKKNINFHLKIFGNVIYFFAMKKKAPRKSNGIRTNLNNQNVFP